MMRMRFPLLLLLGIVFLASLSVSFGRQRHPDEEEQSSNNPFYISSDRLQTLFHNQYGQIRLLNSLHQRSNLLENLRDYALLEFKSKPNTLLLPHHLDAHFILLVLSGRAVVTLVNNDERNSYILEKDDALGIPAGTTYYVVNPDDNQNLRLIKLAIPVNKPGQIQQFFLSSTQYQQSYLQGFSNNILEASYNTELKEIKRVLFGEERQELEGVIVQLSKEQIRELSRNAKPSSSISSKDEPFNLKSRNPIYSNNFGKLFEVTPEKNPQLRQLNILLGSLYLNKGALMLPHYNSKAILILVVNEGKAKVESVGQREKEKQQQEKTREVQRYRAELSEDDIYLVPAAYPIALNATSNLNILAIGINAENNQRNFLAGEKDNVISHIHKPVIELAFPGPAQEVEKLIKNTRESYFADAQSQQRQDEERKRARSDRFASILGA
ncbi:hypothetical protein VNO78_15389 [Psophocarpus tetragonolobus]|uniref:Cupin type-1 domain-containing protein n=1 Tax=Psophocarpus tetragonolobus TaxID=3891 RepID=A0AAN9SDX7_PSOTE